jgi:DNA primase
METFTSKIDFIRKCFGESHTSRCGNNVAVSCPACSNSKKKKFSININNWSCHCWVCGIKGKNISKILFEHVSQDLSREFRSRFLKDENSYSDKAEIEEEVVNIPNGFISIAQNIRSKDPDIRACIQYLFSRNVSERDMWYYKIGTTRSGKFRRRIIIPSFDFEGKINYFSARAIDETSYKYINSKNKKIDIVFNEINIDWRKELCVVEGPFDLLKSSINSTCLLGSDLSMSSLLFKKIASARTPIVLALDKDMEKKITKIADLLQDYSCQVRILDTGDRSDVGEMTKDEFIAAREKAYAWNRRASLTKRIHSIGTGSIF